MILPFVYLMPPPPPPPPFVAEVYKRWATMDIRVKFEVMPCGQVNASYIPERRTIRLCTEMLDALPELTVRHVLNHELAHAFQWQHGIERNLWDVEFEADELGFGFSTEEEVLSAVDSLMTCPDCGGGTHPTNRERAAMLSCLHEGSENRLHGTPARAECIVYEKSAMEKWSAVVFLLSRR